ncbi:MAG: FAD synthase [Nitrosopumilus sp.]|nr:FAD synthase [Nitrosopumilus sp.]MDA7952769.1 FAD synthase [Nitrosopumilus sp.]MDA7957741.1 FAD synthase [Nitrosopumilus sp.]MDA7960164.1 FAD synthase [Nitrosopumilus sp.]
MADGARDGLKEAVAAAYVAGLGGRAPEGIAALEGAGLAGSDGALTAGGRSMIRVVLAGGVFDIIHPGHIHTLRAARRLGDVLVVVAAADETAVKMKKRRPLHSQAERVELVESLRMVDACVAGGADDIFRTVGAVGPDVIALGYDQAHQEDAIRQGCRRIGLDAEVVRLRSPVPSRSSSKIRSEYGGSIHGI